MPTYAYVIMLNLSFSLKGHTGDGEIQPTPKQIAELAASVAAYDKWDKVLVALRP